MFQTKRIQNQLSEIDWDFAGYNPNGRGTGIHNIHWYPAPFPPGVAGTLIEILGSGCESFLDPFCGSSVAPFEAWFLGKKVFAVDNNHFAIDIANAKVQLIREGSLDLSKALIEDYFAFRAKRISSFSRMRPENVCKKTDINPGAIKWFTPSVLAEIAILKLWIVHNAIAVRKWRNVLLVTLSALLHGRFSIARNYHYTYVVDNSRVKDEARGNVDVRGIFANKLLDNMVQGQIARERFARVSNVRDIPVPEFEWGRAQEITTLAHEQVDLVVTSPPYFGMNDYVRSQYLTWLIFQWSEYEHDLSQESGSRRSRNSRTSLDSYFGDMFRSFSEIHRVLRKGGYLGLVLGSSTTKLAREIDPLHELKRQLAELDFRTLWEGKRRVRFRKINNTPFRDEVIWILQR
jgi:SAM-dependent methyltransferase